MHSLYAAGIIGFVLGLSAGMVIAAYLVRKTHDEWQTRVGAPLARTSMLIGEKFNV